VIAGPALIASTCASFPCVFILRQPLVLRQFVSKCLLSEHLGLLNPTTSFRSLLLSPTPRCSQPFLNTVLQVSPVLFLPYARFVFLVLPPDSAHGYIRAVHSCYSSPAVYQPWACKPGCQSVTSSAPVDSAVAVTNSLSSSVEYQFCSACL